MLLAVVKAIEGRETLAIAEALSRGRAFVQRWAYAHCDRGIEAVAARKRGGDRSKIKGVLSEHLKARLDAGPTPADRVCVRRGKEVQRIAKRGREAQRKFREQTAAFVSAPSRRRSRMPVATPASTSWTRRASASKGR